MAEKDLREKVVDVMRSWYGLDRANGTHKPIIDIYNSQEKLPRGYAVKMTDSYCATAVSSAFIKAGLGDLCPIECSCNQMIGIAKRRHIWEEKDNTVPSAGDIIFYDWDDDGNGDCLGGSEHTGIVEMCDGEIITVLEGNMHGKVGRRKMKVNARFIRGFCLPEYSKLCKNENVYLRLANDVILGKYGNGKERARRISEMGYNYKRVQRLVNKILG